MASGDGGSTTSKCSHEPSNRASARCWRAARRMSVDSVAAVRRRDLLAEEKPESGAADAHILFGRQPAEPREHHRRLSKRPKRLSERIESMMAKENLVRSCLT
jgi:hypothetical protein